ncbi:MAG: RNA polymerase sigma factor [Parcubacteria group bacterium]
MTENTLSDKEVLEKSFENPRYFEVLVDRYQNAFMRRSMSIVKNKEEAEDIVQEAFLKIYKGGKNWKEREGAWFKSWAYAVLRNTCYSHYKKKKRYDSRVMSVDFNEHDFGGAEPVWELEEEPEGKKLDVESVLSLMPQSLSRIIRLYFLEEKSQKEIAMMENLSPGAVRVRIHRAKNYFRRLNTHPI